MMDNDKYLIKNPKYYLVVLDSDGCEVDELIFTREAILNYLKNNEDTSKKTEKGV